MTLADVIRERLPNASPDCLKVNADIQLDSPRTVAELECDSGDAALGEVQVQKGTGRKFLVRVTSVRKRLLDEDNLCEKYHVDLCRYAGVLPDDAPGETRIEVCQEKAGKEAAEETKIEVFEISP